MEFSKEKVRAVAALANLRLTDAEIGKLAVEMSGVLTHMEQLEALDTTGVEPMAQVLYPAGETAALRQDEVRPTTVLGTNAALANSALSGAGHYKVPKVIER
jgi:aspartyl-tRNA(Asn)/glutamyl-tRNA(Gln) amidotransferase subunit C